jgi:4-amino-4-deoxy-L-arabinose transferase-like glycosyltransferase
MVPAENSASWRRDLLILGLLFAVLLGFRLGRAPLANPDEGRYAEIPREMVVSGDWVTPRLNGVNYFEKPPLMYWAVAACYQAFGPGEGSMRAVPVGFALGGVLLAYAAGRRLYGRWAGVAAAVVLGTSLIYFILGRVLLLDMAVSVLMSAALFCFLLGVREPAGARRRWLFYGLYASMALATLTKGLIGFLVPGAVMFLWLLVFNQWQRLRPLHLPAGALLFLALALPWHVLAALHNPTWAHRYFVYEHWQRFTTTVAGRVEPWWYFGPIVVLGLFPWTGFLGPAVRAATRGGWAARKQNADAWFLLTWAGFVFLFFSVSGSKLIPYILPVFPPLAVLIGASLVRVAAGTGRARAGLGVFSAGCGLLAIALLVVVLKPGIIRDAWQAEALRPFALALAAVLLAGGLFTPWFARRRGPGAAFGGIALTMAMFLALIATAMPHIQKPGTKELALYVKAHAAPGDRVVQYHDFFQDFLFYAQRDVEVTGTVSELELEEDAAARASGRFYDEAEFRRRWEGPQRVWVVARRREVRELFADPTFHYHLLGEGRNHYLFSNRP